MIQISTKGTAAAHRLGLVSARIFKLTKRDDGSQGVEVNNWLAAAAAAPTAHNPVCQSCVKY